MFLINSCKTPGPPLAKYPSSVDEVAAGGKIEVRGDAEFVGFNETYTLRIQDRLRKNPNPAATPVSRSETKLSRRELEKMYAPVFPTVLTAKGWSEPDRRANSGIASGQKRWTICRRFVEHPGKVKKRQIRVIKVSSETLGSRTFKS
jgi:hypothetical protein